MKKPVTLLVISLCLFQTNLNTIFAQDTYADTLNCLGGTPTYIVDLSSSPDSAWVSTPSSRAGSCCVPPDNNCVQFVIELSPLAVGIIFTLPDGCGAAPTGSLFYQVDCGPLTTIGTPLCLSGTGPFVLTFCKPGNNANCYGIESIPEPEAGVDVITADGCVATLSVTGLDLSTITWNSVSPGLPQDYNSYLDCPVGCDIVTVTPQPGYPPSIDYQVCGEAIGACASTPFCDTINVTIVPTLFAEILPINPSICFGSPGTTITANPIGGAAPYNYLWNTGATTQSLFVTAPGTYYVQITDATDCPAAYDTIVVTQFANIITADAGPDVHICASMNPSVNLNGIITGTTTGVWTNGNGTFSPDSTNLNAVYTASADEVLAGFAELYLTTTNNGTCPPDSDTLIIFLHTFTTLLDTNIININCFNLGNGAIDLILTGGALPATYQWQSGQLSEDIINLIPDNYQVMVTDSNGCVDSLSASINEPPPLMITDSLFSIYPSGTNISCFGLSDGFIDITVNGGVPNYTFYWSNGATTEDLVNVPAGIYSVLVVDDNGCATVEAFNLTEPPPLTESISSSVYPSGDNISCFGLSDGSANLIISGGSPMYNYLWSNGSTTEDLTNIQAGTYSVTVTDMNGCVITSSITLTEPSVLTESITSATYPSGDNISCFGLADGSIDLTILGGSPTYNYLWSNGSSTEDLTNIPAGNYSVTATDINGCTINSSITLIEPSVLTESITSATYPSGDNISCFGLSDGSVDLTISGGSPTYNFSWSNGSSTEDLSNIPAGNYSVNVTDINGCIIASSITLTEPSALTESITSATYPSGDNISCFGLADGSVDLIISGGSPTYNFSWSNGSSTEDLSNIPAGNYSVNVTDINGCNIVSDITLTEPPALTESIASATYPSGDNISCFGLSDGSVDLTISGGSPGYNFSWSNGSSTEDLSNIQAGNYNVTVTDLNGCTINSTITLTEPAMLSIGMTPSAYPGGYNVTGCGTDGTIDLTINGGSPLYNYTWNNGSVSEDLSGLDEGLYSVVITDMNGCNIADSIYMTAPAPMSANGAVSSYIGGWNISCPDASDGNIDLAVTGGVGPYHFFWSNGSTNEDLSGIPAGFYSVLIMDAHGCEIELDFDLIQPPPLVSTIEALQYFGGWNVSCFGEDDGAIDLSVSGGTGPYFFSWNNGAGTEDLTGITEGSYDVIYTDQNGCAGTTSIILNEPPVLTATISVLSNYYGMEVSCEGEMDGKLAVNPAGGTPDYSFMWNTTPVQTGSSAGNLGEGTYIVTVTDVNGCVTTDTITLNANPLPEVILPDPLTACYGEMVIVDVSSNMSYGCELTFSTGQILSDCGPYPMFFDYVGCIDAELTVISAEECENSIMIDNYICFHPEPDASFVADPTTATTLHPDVHFWNYSDGGASYEWDFGDGEFSYDYDVYHFYNSGIEGEYEVNLYVTSEFGCVDTATQIIKIVEEFAMYVPNVFTPDANDYNNTFLPVFGGGFDPENYTLLIYDRWGELVFESHNTDIGWDGTYKNGICQDGVYVWVIQIDDKFYQLPTRYEGHVVLLK